MLTLTGKLIGLARGSNTNRDTGVIEPTVSVEILHKERGRSVVESLKIEPAAASGWDKFVDKDVVVEVRPYALKGDNGIVSGLALADKKAYPTLPQVSPAAALKAA